MSKCADPAQKLHNLLVKAMPLAGVLGLVLHDRALSKVPLLTPCSALCLYPHNGLKELKMDRTFGHARETIHTAWGNLGLEDETQTLTEVGGLLDVGEGNGCHC
jgi:hypothetical protein